MPGKINFKPPSDTKALRFLSAKKSKLSFNWKDLYGAEHAYAFTVAKVETLQLLGHFKNSLTDALEQGQTFRDWKKNIEPVIRRSGWMGIQEKIDPLTGELVTAELGTPRRLRVIFDTNMRQARHAGQWERVQDTKQHLPYLQYRLGPSEEHRPEHASWDGMVLPVDDSWWDTHHPQNGWGCKCWTKQLTTRQAQKLGISKAPPLENRSMVNKRTGEVIEVPKGIDPGFEFNPGRHRMKIANAFTEQTFDEASPQLARAAIGDYMADPNIVEVFKNAERAQPVGYAPDFLLELTGVKNPLILMSANKAKTHVVTHAKDVPTKFYGRIPDIIDAPDSIRIDNKGVYYLFREALSGPKELVLLHPTSDKDKFFLKTAYYAGNEEEARQINKTRLIWEDK